MNWRERLLAEGATLENKVLAASWATCYVGVQRAAHPNVVVYEEFYEAHGEPTPWEAGPEDQVLWNLGQEFLDEVKAGRVEGALGKADRIDDRVLALKRGEG